VLILSGSVLTAIGVAYMSKDWCCSPVSSALMAGIVIGVADRYLLCPLLRNRHWVRKAQVLFVFGCVLGFSLLGKANEDGLFKEAVGVRPSPGVKQLVVDLNEMTPAGGGEQTILLRFSADRQTIEELVKEGRLARDDETVDEVAQEGGGWEKLWHAAFYPRAKSGGQAWTGDRPMKSPILYRKRDKEHFESTSLLWDEDSGRAYVMFQSG
jgi:hypothetical protein